MHAATTGLLFLVAFILFWYARTDSIMAAVDAVTIFHYKKPPMQVDDVKEALSNATNFLGTDPYHCRDMHRWMLPTVTYLGASPNCDIRFTVDWVRGSDGKIANQRANITAVDYSNAVDCVPGTYVLDHEGGQAGSSFSFVSPHLVISGTYPNQHFSFVNSSTDFGGAW